MDVIDHLRAWKEVLKHARSEEEMAGIDQRRRPWTLARESIEEAIAALELATKADQRARVAFSTARETLPTRPTTLVGRPTPGPRRRPTLPYLEPGGVISLEAVRAWGNTQREYHAAWQEGRSTLRALAEQVLRCALGIALKGPLRPADTELVRTTVWFHDETDLLNCNDATLRGLGMVVQQLGALVIAVDSKCG